MSNWTRREFIENSTLLYLGFVSNPGLPDHANVLARYDLISNEQWRRRIFSSSEKEHIDLNYCSSRYKKVAQAQRKSPDWIVPSNAYKEMYTRDAVYNVLSDMDLSNISVLLSRLNQTQKHSGQIATYIDPHKKAVYYDDESTLMYLLLAATLKKNGLLMNDVSVNASVDYILSHIAADGSYQTGGKAPDRDQAVYHYWLDSINLFNPASPAYVQGLLAIVMQNIGFASKIDRGLADMVIKRYEAIFSNGFPAMGLGSDIWDVSALSPEALSLLLFDEPLLSTDVVKNSYNLLRQKTSALYPNGSFLGFKVVTRAGKFLPAQVFFPGNELNYPGSYQNGGSWTLWDTLAIYAAGRHGVDGAQDDFVARIASDFYDPRSQCNEFLATSGSVPTIKGRNNYGWNGLISRLI